jgi:hypothetical protein
MLDLVKSTNATPIVFTLTATPETTRYGYVEGRSYTLVFRTGQTFALNGLGAWEESGPWSSVQGTGLIGSYTRGLEEVVPKRQLTTPEEITVRDIDIFLPSIANFRVPRHASSADPGEFMAACYGTYTPGQGAHVSLLPEGGDWLSFSVTSVTIAPAVIPEPGTTMLPLSAAAMTLCGRRSCLWWN